jgi:sugar phosphate isomerase/epimerase
MQATPDRLAVNQFMVPDLRLDELCRISRSHGIAGLGILRAALDELGPAEIRRTLASHGIRPTSVCVIMGLTGRDADERAERFADAVGVLQSAADLGAPIIVVVGGPAPGLPLPEAITQATDAVAALDARAAVIGGRILLEPLHPMLVGLSAFTSLRQAAALAAPLKATSLVLDTWHVWSEPGLEETVARYGADLEIIHLADWSAGPIPTTDRELPGCGIADLSALCVHIGTATAEQSPWWEIEVLSERLSDRHGPADLLDVSIRHTKALLWPDAVRSGAANGRETLCASSS